jgi:exodeoxyribonuclease VII small subunit
MSDDPTASGTPMPTSYEQARTELAEIVRALEAGSQSLEESLALWERGEALAALCGTWLEAARARLDAGSTPADDTDG